MKKHLMVLSLFAAIAVLMTGIAHAETAGLLWDSSTPGIKLTWKAPSDTRPEKVKGYNLYRSEEIGGHYNKVNDQPVTKLDYEDRALQKGKDYFYRITTIFVDGTESAPTDPVGMTAGAANAQELRLPKIDFLSSNALGKVLYMGDEAVFILSAEPGLTAKLDIEGVAAGMQMKEAEPGSYKANFIVPQGLRVKDASATATVVASNGGKASVQTKPFINFLGIRKPALSGLYAGILEAGRVGLNWPKAQGVDGADGWSVIYKDTSRILGFEGLNPVTGRIARTVAAYIDGDVAPGRTYYYVLAQYDAAGSLTAYSDNLEVTVPQAGRVSGIESVEEDSAGNTMKPGSTLKVTVKTASGCKASFALGDTISGKPLAEAESGIYTGSYTFKDGDGQFKSRVSVSLRDASGDTHFASSATFVAVDAPRVSATAAGDGKKPQVFGIKDDIQTVVGRSGRLTAGKTFTVTLKGDTGAKGYFSVGNSIWRVPMKEDPAAPGMYSGSYTVRAGDSAGVADDPLNTVFITGWLESSGGTPSDKLTGPMPVIIDTSVNIAVDISSHDLLADARSQAKVTFTVTDADGEFVPDRRLTVLIEPTAKYTGVAGSGGVDRRRDGQDAAQGVLGRLQVDFDDMTDRFGRVTATYTSGFAAKTAMVVARDFATGSVGMGYVTTSISSSVNIALTEPAGTIITAPVKPIYQLSIDVVPDPANPVHTYPGFILDTIPNSLTADGTSRASIVAVLTKDGVPAVGNTIIFGASGADGSFTKAS
ncbi:MAG TPA: hypothetical protein VGK71_09830, partial [Nitrospirota bacterium]